MATSGLEVGRGRNLWTWWTKGEGLALWAESPTPYRSLVAALARYVPAAEVHGLAATAYHAVFGVWPGRHDRHDGHPTAGEMVAAKINVSRGK
jgi:hypothetical protein